MIFFFFSSRRRHTRLQGDWSSDVCSSDLGSLLELHVGEHAHMLSGYGDIALPIVVAALAADQRIGNLRIGMLLGGEPHRRSEERRVGKECRSRWSPYH